MIGRALTILAAVSLLSGTSLHAADLAAARSLYASASYEEALAMLASLESNEDFEQLHELRALCLLALGRNREAEEAIEQMVLHSPARTLESSDVSPKLVAVFQDVRRRTLPIAARSMYTKAKSAFDAKEWTSSKQQFVEMIQLLADPELAGQQTALSDLRELGEGFLKLADAELAADMKRAEVEAQREEEAAAAARLAAAETAAAAALQAASDAAPAEGVGTAAAAPSTSPEPPGPAPAVAAPIETPEKVYTAADRDVTPPVEVQRVFPRWRPPTRALALTIQTGLLEILVDEKGAVVSAAIAKPISPAYDASLLKATEDWRYRPAMKDGQPVRFRQLLEIVLRPQE